MTNPVSGGVPEQGRREAAQRLESRAAAQGITVLEAELQDAVIAARRELNRLCGGGKWQMTIPVDLHRDSDVILGNLVALADKLVFEAEKRGAALERPRPALPSLDEQMTAKIAALEAKNDARDKSNEKGPALPAPEPPECTCPKVPTDTQGRGGFGWSSECPAHRVLYGAALPAEPDRYDFPCGCRVWREEDHSLSTRTCEAHHAQWLKALPTMGASGANGVPAEHAPSDDRPDHDEMAEIPFEERYAVTNFPYTKPSNPNSAAPQPTYYVGHPNGTYTVADPQPDTRAGHPEGESP